MLNNLAGRRKYYLYYHEFLKLGYNVPFCQQKVLFFQIFRLHGLLLYPDEDGK